MQRTRKGGIESCVWNLFHTTFLILPFLIALFSGCSNKPDIPASERISQAKQALNKSEFASVEEFISKVSPESELWQAGQILAGEAAFKDGSAERAVKYYLAAADHDKSTSDGQLALFSAAEIYLDQGQLSKAEPLYREVLSYQPNNGLTHQRMAMLLSITGRRWKALDHYYSLVKGGDANYLELGITADIGRQIEQGEFLAKCQKQAPADLYVRIAVATHAFEEGESTALSLLQNLVSDDPKLISAQAMLGQMLVEEQAPQDFLQWHEALPTEAEQSPDIWFARGLWARRHSELKSAAECFEQSVILSPFHRRAFYLLGQVLVSLNDPRATEVVAYSERLIELSQTIDDVLVSKGHNEAAVQKTVSLLEQLGRIWETCAWSVLARRNFPQSEWPHEVLERHAYKLSPELVRVDPEQLPVHHKPNSDLPSFERLVAQISNKFPSDSALQKDNPPQYRTIQFTENRQIDFQYNNGDDPDTKGARTFEQTGGGVAILDYDGDGTPDVFLPQGSDWIDASETPTPSTEFQDQLFRNVEGVHFQNVSHALSGPDSGFGQGCSAGDFNNDGFTDLYVANVGQNCLYQNMGDGTFSQVTDIAGLNDDAWTVSVMICDLNADGYPDLFDVNYLEGEGLYTKICQGHACSPSVFDGAPDQLWINQGDGRFIAATHATPQSESKGLGIVAFELDEPQRPLLFIANDQVANFFLDNQPADNPYNIQLEDRALLSGLAFNLNGLSMACMGITVDDWDGNNLVDIFVTNFQDEPNTLYLQDYPGLFVDSTKPAGLHLPSIPMTGWGTQSLDADLDGKPDLIVVNGHVDDYRDEGGPYQMSPQLFQNVEGQFQELSADEAGDWFAGKYLGRGLARVDWNLDGRPEFIASNMNSPASVLQNTTQQAGNFLSFRLTAVDTARDAIGARIKLRIGDREIERQLTAGDGYMASNERLVQFGLGAIEQVEEAEIRWPSGQRTRLNRPTLNATYLLVEKSERATGQRGTLLSSISVIPLEASDSE